MRQILGALLAKAYAEWDAAARHLYDTRLMLAAVLCSPGCGDRSPGELSSLHGLRAWRVAAASDSWTSCPSCGCGVAPVRGARN